MHKRGMRIFQSDDLAGQAPIADRPGLKFATGILTFIDLREAFTAALRLCEGCRYLRRHAALQIMVRCTILRV
jgi:hypothetical protein